MHSVLSGFKFVPLFKTLKMKTKSIVIGIAQGLLSLALLMAGIMKMSTPYEELLQQMAWIEAVPPAVVLLIGALEVLGVIGMNLPFLLKKFKKLVPVAAGGLALTMLGAVFTHVALGENFVAPLVLFAIAAFVTYSRKDLLRGEA